MIYSVVTLELIPQLECDFSLFFAEGGPLCPPFTLDLEAGLSMWSQQQQKLSSFQF